MQLLSPGSARANTVRVFEDGNFFGPKIGFATFRFEGGLIVEHWDNLQETHGNKSLIRAHIERSAAAPQDPCSPSAKATARRSMTSSGRER